MGEICSSNLFEWFWQDCMNEIHNEYNSNQMILEIFLQRITEINRLNYNEVIANLLCALKRFDILLCVALDGK